MVNLFKRQDGVTPVVAVLIILVVGIVGVAALRTSDAYWTNINKRPRPVIIRPTTTTNSGSSVTCTANGVPGTVVNGVCTATSNTGATGTCTVNGVEQPLVNGTCQATSSGSQGSTTNTCIVNGVSYPVTNGTCQVTSQGASGSGGTSHCTVNGQTVPCQ